MAHPLHSTGWLRLAGLPADDIAALLARQGMAGEQSAALAPRISKGMTQGEPLMARFVCEDVAQRGQATLATLEKRPPQDVEKYFANELEKS